MKRRHALQTLLASTGAILFPTLAVGSNKAVELTDELMRAQEPRTTEDIRELINHFFESKPSIGVHLENEGGYFMRMPSKSPPVVMDPRDKPSPTHCVCTDEFDIPQYWKFIQKQYSEGRNAVYWRHVHYENDKATHIRFTLVKSEA